MKLSKDTRPPPDAIDSVYVDQKRAKRIICDGDLHYPIHDPAVEAAKLAFARDIKPDVWVNVGDVWDCWSLSKYDKEPSRLLSPGARLQEEFDASRPYWSEVSKLTDRAHLILGNHERRLNQLVVDNFGLFGLKALEWDKLAELPSNVLVHRYGKRLRIGSMTFEHGDKIPPSKHPASMMLDKRGDRNVIFGHTHRLEVKHMTRWDEDGCPHHYVAINQGHGSDVAKQTYIYEPSWTHGFTFVECWTEAGKPRFTAHAIAVVNGRFSWGGKVYDGKRWM